MAFTKKALAPAEPVSGELQQMWLQVVRATWSSLAIVPTDPSISALPVATALIEMAPFYELGAFQLVDAVTASLQDGARIAREVGGQRPHAARTVIAVGAPAQSGGAVPILLAADACLLVVRLRASHLDAARTVIDLVGRERVLGSVVVR